MNGEKLYLKDCPFCGEDPHPVYGRHGYTWCDNAECPFFGHTKWSEEWNNRPQSLAERQIEAIRAVVERYLGLSYVAYEIERILEEDNG